MSNLTRLRLALASILLPALCAVPMPASAQTQTNPSMSAEQAQAAFAQGGFQVDRIVDWGWLVPSVRSFVVHDLATRRVLMVLVFPSVDDANQFRGGIAMQQQSSRPDPHILAGYGPSIWSGNLGLLQSTESQLERVAQLQADQDNDIYDDPNNVLSERSPNIVVDLDFQQALRNSVANL